MRSCESETLLREALLDMNGYGSRENSRTASIEGETFSVLLDPQEHSRHSCIHETIPTLVPVQWESDPLINIILDLFENRLPPNPLVDLHFLHVNFSQSLATGWLPLLLQCTPCSNFCLPISRRMNQPAGRSSKPHRASLEPMVARHGSAELYVPSLRKL